ncbi:unnamed protein product [Caenorhabditis angaria]|uniref:Uncharacterized protein n=1 Tax=Caenorhabditis angaria TaxID=860376 RepID=A0A9P1NA66_9PELO|nr:unnamed protein product [Caenorhabditis angaria]
MFEKLNTPFESKLENHDLHTDRDLANYIKYGSRYDDLTCETDLDERLISELRYEDSDGNVIIERITEKLPKICIEEASVTASVEDVSLGNKDNNHWVYLIIVVLSVGFAKKFFAKHRN